MSGGRRPPQGKSFKAVQIGGPSGGCLPESKLDIPIDFDSLSAAGTIMGSGGLVVLDEDDCMVSIARYFLQFTQEESCGKCTFCRLGTKHMLDILTAICDGKGDKDSLKVLHDLSEDVQAGSLCNLGATAPNPVLTTLRYFRHEYDIHIDEKMSFTCLQRTDRLLYRTREMQQAMQRRVGSCPPTEAIYTRDDGLKAIDQTKCVKCDNCLKTCPPDYNAAVKLSPPEILNEKEAK